MRSVALTVFVITLSLASGLLCAAETDTAQLAFFENKIRPLLSQHCYSCHSVKAKKLKAHLYVDSLAGLLKGGDNGPSIVPGKPEKSLLIEAVRYTNVDMQMPPDDKLSVQQIADLTEWVKAGAPWPKEEVGNAAPEKEKFDIAGRKAKHWAWEPIKPTEPPPVKENGWTKSPIDKFVFAKLAEKNFTPAPPADKRLLIRRAYYDLTGLPPPPEAVEAFLNDSSPNAFDKIVDGLLASPQFGERWARHWLDLVRYAETLGHEFDFNNPNAYRYRDYVIRALNSDLPYDQFVTEHIAGDRLEKPRLHPTEGFNESIIATGFYFLGEEKHSPVDIRQAQADRFDNMIDITSKTFLSMTIACARCHDHKFDAISAADYYSMYGFLKSSRFTQAQINPAKYEAQARELASLKKEIKQSAAAGFQKNAAQISQYLLASHEVMYGAAKSSDAQSKSGTAQSDVVFEDFETGYDGWEVTGTAFGPGPYTQDTLSKYQGDVGAAGKGFVNSHNMRTGKGDADVGTMTSKPFVIAHRRIEFLIGGGAHPGKTCLNLLIDGKVVRSATGKNDNRMSPGSFDVAEFAGKSAKLQIVDAESGGWGNIGVDHIVFCDKGAAPKQLARPVASVAKDFGVDAAILDKVVNALAEKAVEDVAHPLHAWAALSKQTAAKGAKFEDAYQKLRADWAQREKAAPPASSAVVLGDFTNSTSYNGWFVEDQAFGKAPARPGEFIVGSSASRPVDSVLAQGGAHSGTLARRLQGVLRSPTFTIDKKFIHVLASGHEAKMSIVVENFVLIRDPIYGKLRRSIKNEKTQWHSVDMSMWQGREAYLEFSDWTAAEITENNPGSPEAYVSIQRVLLSDENAPPNQAAPAARLLVGDEAVDSAKTLSERYQQAAIEALADWAQGTLAEKPGAEARAALLDWLVKSGLNANAANDANLSALIEKYNQLSRSIDNPERTLAITDGTSEDERVFIRGSYKTLGPVTPRRLLEAINPNDAYKGEGSGRLELAKKITDPANPLTTRVIVNRIWHHLFGRGIVPSVDNFGVLGAEKRPEHMALLDYLATQFVKNGWSIKKSIRSVMLSATYQMASAGAGPGDEIDPENNLMRHAEVRRLQAEAIRDGILSVSGRLNPQMYGPGVNVHLNTFMDGRGRPDSGPIDGNGRRSLYLSVRRNFLSPMLLAFDAPQPFSSMGRRNVSNVPAQALTMLNDPFVLQQAQEWAKRVLAEAQLTPAQRISKMYMSAFARTPSEAEMAAALAFIEQQSKASGKQAELQAWTDLAHVLINSKEFIFLN